VITPEEITVEDLNKNNVPTALHLHFYYSEMADSILARVSRCKSRPDLLISVGDQLSKNQVELILLKYGLEARRIAIVPNAGRDIGPMLTEFRDEIMANYQIVGHIHSKKSVRLQNPEFSELWSNFLYGNLISDKKPMMDTILKRIYEDPALGLVFPDDPHILGWGYNKEAAIKLMDKMKISKKHLYENINFPVGTMFWARVKALQPLFELNLDWKDYPEEPLPYDGTMLHAIERMLPIITESQNFQCQVTCTTELTR
jgi:lipopolysaccharide biosynthesis protein